MAALGREFHRGHLVGKGSGPIPGGEGLESERRSIPGAEGMIAVFPGVRVGAIPAQSVAASQNPCNRWLPDVGRAADPQDMRKLIHRRHSPDVESARKIAGLTATSRRRCALAVSPRIDVR